MTAEEKQAVQTIILQELNMKQQENPTLLFDVVMGGQGWQMIHGILSNRAALAKREYEVASHLIRVVMAEMQTDQQKVA